MSDKVEIFEAARRVKALMEHVHQYGHNVVNDTQVKGAWATDIPLIVHGLLSFSPEKAFAALLHPDASAAAENTEAAPEADAHVSPVEAASDDLADKDNTTAIQSN